MNVFHHTGDLGDIIASLPIIREMGGGKLVISDAQFPLGFGPRETLRGKRFEALQPIVKAAPYLTDIEWHDNPQRFITHDIASFRRDYWKPYETLVQWQSRYFDLPMPDAPAPWLHVPNPKMHNKIVVGRTARYHTSFFPWRLIVDKYAKDILFVGLPTEYGSFLTAAKVAVDYHKTNNLLEAAEIIAGSRLFIGGQSVLFWIAAGLGHPLIQETCEWLVCRNSIIPRANAFYSDTTENLEKIYDELKLDKRWAKRYPVPEPRVNLTTSAAEFRRNLTTSAELYQALDLEQKKYRDLRRLQRGTVSPSFA
jgi:hypothetical protein